MTQQRPQQGRKRKRRKRTGHYLRGFHHWVGAHKTTRKLAARKQRREDIAGGFDS